MFSFREAFLRIVFLLQRLQRVGRDSFGNTYYEWPSKLYYRKTRRFVLYKGPIEASNIPPLWNAWLHGMNKDLPQEEKPLSWQRKHLPNLTGTIFAHKVNFYSKSSTSYSPWEPTKKEAL